MVPAPGSMVLVVEDDPSMREAIGRLLNAAGLDCAAYATAELMLAGGLGERAACVVSDLKLPAMSGFDLLDVLRAHGGCAPFVVITAHDAPGLREEAVRRGAAAYLAKPFRGTVLLDAVKAAIETGRA